MNTRPLPPEIKTDRFIARLYRYVCFNGSCWEFTGGLNTDGYPVIKVAGRRILAHRASYEIHKGNIPDGLLVCHKCDNPPCINPLHLFVGTVQKNTQDAAAKGRLATGERNGQVIYRKRIANGEIAAPIPHVGVQAGEDNPAHKLTIEDVQQIRALYATGLETYKTLALRFNVTKGCTAHVCQRLTWKTVP